MGTIQGEFQSNEQARKAVEALRSAGFSGGHVRLWNVIPEAPRASGNVATMAAGPLTGGVTAAAAIGGFVFFGLPGLVLGALVGGTVTGTFTAGIGGIEGSSLPQPTGYRVVVDLGHSGADAASILSQLGADHIRRIG